MPLDIFLRELDLKPYKNFCQLTQNQKEEMIFSSSNEIINRVIKKRCLLTQNKADESP